MHARRGKPRLYSENDFMADTILVIVEQREGN